MGRSAAKAVAELRMMNEADARNLFMSVPLEFKESKTSANDGEDYRAAPRESVTQLHQSRQKRILGQRYFRTIFPLAGQRAVTRYP